MKRLAALVCCLLAASTSAAGCAGGGDEMIEIDVHYSHFEPAAITVAAGEPIRFMLKNEDFIDHEWIVGDEALHARHQTGTEPSHGDRPTEQTLPANGTVRTTVTFETAGTFKYICHLPGHEAYGMVGTITVLDG